MYLVRSESEREQRCVEIEIITVLPSRLLAQGIISDSEVRVPATR